jgi:hypothetical protein
MDEQENLDSAFRFQAIILDTIMHIDKGLPARVETWVMF